MSISGRPLVASLERKSHRDPSSLDVFSRLSQAQLLGVSDNFRHRSFINLPRISIIENRSASDNHHKKDASPVEILRRNSCYIRPETPEE